MATHTKVVKLNKLLFIFSALAIIATSAAGTDRPLGIRVLPLRDFRIKMVDLVRREVEPPAQIAGSQLAQQFALRHTLTHQRAGTGDYRVQLVLVCFQPGSRDTGPLPGTTTSKSSFKTSARTELQFVRLPPAE